jgi:hypothetical protein
MVHATELALAAVLTLAAAGCSKCSRTPAETEPPPHGSPLASTDGGLVVELGSGDPDSAGHLGFVIRRVYSGEQPSEAPPWHVPGGDWTFFDAELRGGAPVPFVVGVEIGAKSGGSSFGFGKSLVAVADADTGARFVERFAGAFRTPVPPPRTRAPLQATTFSIAVLGTNMSRSLTGVGGHDGGGWTGTKWFLQDEGLEAEVFFNYDLGAHIGEFSEKDEDYRQDLLRSLANRLRDGPLPERTPATDPRLTDVGPHPEAYVDVGSSRATFFDWNGAQLLYRDEVEGGGQVLHAVTPPTVDAPIEVLRVEARLGVYGCLGVLAAGCLFAEDMPTVPNQWSTSDPRRFWWVVHPGAAKTPVTGPWDDKHLSLPTAPLSPDGRWIALRAMVPRDAGRGKDAVTLFIDRGAGTSRTFSVPGVFLDVVGWQASAGALRAIVRKGPAFSKEEPSKLILVDPALAAQVTGVPKLDAPDKAASPDGKRRCEIRASGGEVAITSVAGGGVPRVFGVHPDDVRYTKDASCSWAGNRYVVLATDRTGLIDADTLKMSYPFPKGEKGGYHFSPDFRWVARYGDRVSVARMKVPE